MPEKLSDVAAAALALRHRPAKPRPDTTKDRSWEHAQRHAELTTQVAYRGMPRDLNEAMKKIAKEEGRNVGQVAVRFMAYALAAHREGVSLATMATHLADVTDR